MSKNCGCKRTIFKSFVASMLLIFSLFGAFGCGSNIDDELQTKELSENNSGSSRQVAAPGASPEETIKIFLEALVQQDVETMLSCCYIKDYFDRFSFEESVDRQGAANLNTAAPIEYPYYRNLMLYERQASFSKQIRILTYSLLDIEENYEDFLSFGMLAPADYAWANNFSNTMNPDQLRNLEVLRIDVNDPESQQDHEYESRLRKTYGSDVQERAVLLNLNGTFFCKGFTLVDINGKWQIAAISSIILADDITGAAYHIKGPAEYEEIIQ